MKRKFVLKFGVPIGLLVMAAGYFSTRVGMNPDWADFFLGMGVAVVITSSLIKIRKQKTS